MENEKTIGYLILESAIITDDVKVVSDNVQYTVIEANLQEADRPNRNKRLYGFSCLNEAVFESPYINERLRTRSLYGEAGHPLSPEMERQLYIDQTRISHIISKIWWEGKILKGIVESAMTEVGRDFQGLIRQKSQVAFSMRGVGPIKENKKEFVEIKKPLSILTWDWVIHPSHDIAYMKSILKENTISGMIKNDQIILSEGALIQLKDYAVSTSKNVKKISEEFEIGIKNTSISEDGKFIDLYGTDCKARVILEDEITRSLDSFLLNEFR
jgi:hypothetical protein